MGAAEKVLGQESSLTLQGRVWRRLRESSGNDDIACWTTTESARC